MFTAKRKSVEQRTDPTAPPALEKKKSSLFARRSTKQKLEVPVESNGASDGLNLQDVGDAMATSPAAKTAASEAQPAPAARAWVCHMAHVHTDASTHTNTCKCMCLCLRARAQAHVHFMSCTHAASIT